MQVVHWQASHLQSPHDTSSALQHWQPASQSAQQVGAVETGPAAVDVNVITTAANRIKQTAIKILETDIFGKL